MASNGPVREVLLDVTERSAPAHIAGPMSDAFGSVLLRYDPKILVRHVDDDTISEWSCSGAPLPRAHPHPYHSNLRVIDHDLIVARVDIPGIERTERRMSGRPVTKANLDVAGSTLGRPPWATARTTPTRVTITRLTLANVPHGPPM